jgi:transposase
MLMPKSFFLKETFETMKASLGEQDRYYFVDAVHPTHNPVLAYSWAPRGQRPQVLSNSARQRLNILGAYNSLDHDYVGFESRDNINAQSLIQLISQLEIHQPQGRIILICDNARYNHARLVREHLQVSTSRVEILFLPPYSPNLNLIERLWGFMKDRLLRDYYPTFAGFQQAIVHFFAHLDNYALDLRSLMTENFQILNSA